MRFMPSSILLSSLLAINRTSVRDLEYFSRHVPQTLLPVTCEIESSPISVLRELSLRL